MFRWRMDSRLITALMVEKARSRACRSVAGSAGTWVVAAASTRRFEDQRTRCRVRSSFPAAWRSSLAAASSAEVPSIAAVTSRCA